MVETLPLQFRAERIPLARPPRAELFDALQLARDRIFVYSPRRICRWNDAEYGLGGGEISR
jgi:hypothetical protein